MLTHFKDNVRDSNDGYNSEKILLLYSIMSAWVLISPEQTTNQQFFLEAEYRKDIFCKIGASIQIRYLW